MTETTGKWSVSDDEERFNGANYDTKEEAIAAAAGELSLDPGERFWVGRAVPISCEEFVINVDNVIEQLQADADDRVGEAAEDWPDTTTEEETQLEEKLAAVLQAWLKETGNEPRFFEITDVEEHTIPENQKTP